MSKRSKKHGDLPSGENVAPQDFRGRDGHVKDTRRVKAPDGISGDWLLLFLLSFHLPQEQHY